MARANTINRMTDENLDLVLLHLLGPVFTSRTTKYTSNEELSRLLPPDRYKDVVAFRLISHRFNHVYTLRFGSAPTLFHKMPRRALDTLLDHLLGKQGTQFASTSENSNHDFNSSAELTPRYLDVRPTTLSHYLLPGDLQNVLNFRLVSKDLNETYKLRFGRRPAILSLPSEIHDLILGYLVNTNTDGKLMPIEKKASLSVESFAVQPPSQEDSNITANYRLVCRQFAQRALRCQFTRVWIRFSKEGFDRLRFVAERPHLARTVRQFSYMIPLFYYQESSLFEEISRRMKASKDKLQAELYERQQDSDNNQRPTINQLQSRLARIEESEKQVFQTTMKAKEQDRIVTQKKDVNGLLFALTACINLEQIRYMKFVDPVDSGWMKVIGQFPDFRERLNAEWNHACEHSAKTLTEALILSGAKNFQRLSSRFMDPTTPLSLSEASFKTISKIAKRLKSLELEFDNRWNLDEKVKELSALFRLVFAEAEALENLHVGFRRLVSVPVGTIFHDIKLQNLSYLGLHQWELESRELVDLLFRYRHIRYLRLRYIRLRRGSWARVLRTIRLYLTLSWISLRGVSYPNDDPHPGGILQPALMHGPVDSDDDSDSDEWTGSESDESDDDDSEADEAHEETGSEESEHEEGTDGLDDDDNEEEEGSDDEESVMGNGVHFGSPVNSMMLPPPELGHNPSSNAHRSARRTSHAGQCHCYNGYAWDKLDDNRESVQEAQWKRWQKWALKSCRLHDAEAARNDDNSESGSEDEGEEDSGMG